VHMPPRCKALIISAFALCLFVTLSVAVQESGAAENRDRELAQLNFRPIEIKGATAIIATGINNSGHIVGTFADENGQHGFRFRTVRFPGRHIYYSVVNLYQYHSTVKFTLRCAVAFVNRSIAINLSS
jgi:hypothetical protein